MDLGTFAPDSLIAGDFPLVTESATVLSGQGVVLRGTLMGKVRFGTPIVTPTVGNTGSGAISAVSLDASAQVGTYVIAAVSVATNYATFGVFAPDGSTLPQLTTNTAYSSHIKLTVTDGAPDYIVGDSIKVVVPAGSGKLVKSLAASADGSQIPSAVLATNVDATSADASAVTYVTGELNEGAVILGAGHTLASVKPALAARGVHLKPAVEA